MRGKVLSIKGGFMIYIDKIVKDIGVRRLFEIKGLRIDEHDKIGLIGDNGIGKTTFLKVILGIDDEYEGRFESDGNIRHHFTKEKEIEFVDYSKANLRKGDRYSPGEMQRLLLTWILSDQEAFVVIDEPTSHLDFDRKEKLIEDLNDRKMGHLIISHDRDFVDRTCEIIFEIEGEALHVFNGNYAFYLEEKARRNKFMTREYEGYVAEKQRLEGVASQIKDRASRVTSTPKRMGNSEARLHKMGGQKNKKKLEKQVKAVRSRIDQLEVKEKPTEEIEIKLSMPDASKIHSKVLFRAKNLSKAFGEKLLFEKSEITIENNRKTALLGANASGKTTLLNMMLEGVDVWKHPNLKIGYYSQMTEIIDVRKSILDNLMESSLYDQSMTRIILARLGFRRDDVYKLVEILSDGERAKVKLAKLLTSDFNYLIFDEPTNYLDIRAIEALESLLSSYDRGFIFVTHDKRFIENIADSLLMIEDKRIKYFNGTLKEYENSKKGKMEDKMDEYLINFRLSSINSRLSMEIPKDERESLEEEYLKLVEMRKSFNK